MRLVLWLAIIFFTAVSELGAQDPRQAAWRTPVPEGTRTREYPAVPTSDRSGHIELVEDLVIGGANDPRGTALFYGVSGVAVDTAGRIFVAEERGQRVQVFDVDGSFVRTLGKRGQGPGEFQRPLGVAVAGNTLVVEDRNNTRFSLWGVEGEHLDDHVITPWPPAIIGGTDAGLVICARYRDVQYTGHVRLLALDLAVAELREYFDLTYDRTPSVELSGGQRLYDMDGVIPRDRPSFAASREGNVYASTTAAYEIVAKDPEGSSRWALRVSEQLRRFTPTREHVEEILGWGPHVSRSDINWPEYEPVIERLDVDDRGNLYVFPWVHPMSLTEERAVDVYSADGDRIFVGFIRDVDWDVALHEFVYAVDEDPVTAEERVIRYRLVLPGEEGQ